MHQLGRRIIVWGTDLFADCRCTYQRNEAQMTNGPRVAGNSPHPPGKGSTGRQSVLLHGFLGPDSSPVPMRV